MIEQYRSNGYYTADDFFAVSEVDELISSLESKQVFHYDFAAVEDHNLLHSISCIQQIALSKIHDFIKSIIGTDAIPFHAIILNKTSLNNWGLDWHQDLKIAVRERIDMEGYDGWTEEAGITHVIPPVRVLEKIAMARIHLDDTDHTNGAIWTIPRSHLQGIIPQAQVPEVVKNNTIAGCPVKKGGVMLMSPLLLHKSPYSISTHNRRILQITYRATGLAGGLKWFY